jgi:Arginine/lysine/ornithine decarboxylases
MHMPGHKRNAMQMENPYLLDITEIDGFDNLHDAEGILKELSERLGHLYQAGSSYPLVNGSTVGILAGISALVHRGDKVLIARNCHKSVFHAVILNGLVPVYCYPQYVEEYSVNGGILAEKMEEALINDRAIKLVVLTSPTYEGIVSDIKQISEVVHSNGAFLLVDEAHGAHFGFHESFPKSAVTLGADIVIQSLHKTLPSFTQTAVLHSNRPEYNRRIEKYLAIYQSSSPSYLLMAGIDRCVSILEEQQELFTSYDQKLKDFYQSMNTLQRLKLLTTELIGKCAIHDFDRSKITISVRGTPLTGHQLHTILREKYRIIMEMETPKYVLAMTSIFDTEEGFKRLSEALLAIDGDIINAEHADRNNDSVNIKTDDEIMLTGQSLNDTGKATRLSGLFYPEKILLPSEAVQDYPIEKIKLKDSCGRISAAFICMYPPGSPLLVPGERMDQDMLGCINRIQQEGITITGLCGPEKDELEVVCQDTGAGEDYHG